MFRSRTQSLILFSKLFTFQLTLVFDNQVCKYSPQHKEQTLMLTGRCHHIHNCCHLQCIFLQFFRQSCRLLDKKTHPDHNEREANSSGYSNWKKNIYKHYIQRQLAISFQSNATFILTLHQCHKHNHNKTNLHIPSEIDFKKVLYKAQTNC